MEPILSVRDLRVTFDTRGGPVTALDGVSFDLREQETLGIVGESGSGKSVTALAIMGLIPKPHGQVSHGEIMFDGEPITEGVRANGRSIRGRDIAMIFQEPMTSLNPVFRIGDQIAESLLLHRNMNRTEAKAEAIDLLRSVGISDPSRRAKSYPHELSGGMRQRVMIAMAISCRPRILIADEPTTALDVTTQTEILNLMQQIQIDFNVAIILITHDMGVVAEMTDRAAVMYAGRLVEHGPTDTVLDNPAHPYTRGLISCIPAVDTTASSSEPPPRLAEIPGVVPPLHKVSKGCSFADRCPLVFGECSTAPSMQPSVTDGDEGEKSTPASPDLLSHMVACHASAPATQP